MSRARWLRLMHQWHWISSAVCLVCMVMFSITGITLNHADDMPVANDVTSVEAELPRKLVRLLGAAPENDTAPLPPELRRWARETLGFDARQTPAEWSEHEVYLDVARPGGDAWLAIDRAAGTVYFEDTDGGWIAWLNDLHKGRDAGPVWKWFIDGFAVAACLFALTGLVLLYMHAGHRPSTWKITGLGVLLPALLLLLFVH